MPDKFKEADSVDMSIEDINIEDAPIQEDKTRISRIDDPTKKPSLNKFDTFFIRIWAVICAFIFKLSDWICAGIKFIIKRDVPRKYVAAFVVIVLIILFILMIALPASANGTAIQELEIFSSGLIAVQKRYDTKAGEPIYKWGYVNKQGVEKIPFIYDGALDFKYGVAFVKVVEQNYGYTSTYWKLIDKKGKDVGNHKFDQFGDDIPVQQFSEDQKLARVKLSGKYGFINNKGKIVIDTIYDDAGPFIGKLARVNAGSIWYFINTKNKQVTQNFIGARDMVDGLAAVQTNSGRWGFINEKGKVVIEAQYDEVSDFYCGYAAVRYGRAESANNLLTYGIIDTKGNIVVPYGGFTSLNILEYFNMQK